jgi:hypothetical protein
MPQMPLVRKNRDADAERPSDGFFATLGFYGIAFLAGWGLADIVDRIVNSFGG